MFGMKRETSTNNIEKILNFVNQPFENQEIPVRIDKDSVINAPLDKIFNYLNKPGNLPRVWSSLTDITDEKISNNGYNFRWVYKMAGMHFEGKGIVTEHATNQWLTIKTQGAVESLITWTFRAIDSYKTRVTLTIDYIVPLPLLNSLTRATIVKMNEQEAELILANLRTIFETRLEEF